MRLTRTARNLAAAVFTLGALVLGAAAQASAAPSTPKEVVTAFYTEGFVQRDIVGAAHRYIGDGYIQHDPEVADGRDAFIAAFGPVVRDPGFSTSIVRIVADGDIVVVYAKAVRDGRVRAVADIYRVAHGRIVEHWDVVQDDPGRTVSGRPFIG